MKTEFEELLTHITLKTLPDATAQEVFDQVKNHLLKQNERSSERNSCMYHGPYGTKCAAGCLIGDDEYSAEWENVTWSELNENLEVPKNHLDLIVNLQHVHDGAHPTSWRSELKKVAEKFKLNY